MNNIYRLTYLELKMSIVSFIYFTNVYNLNQVISQAQKKFN